MNGVTAMDENGDEIKSPIKRLGSTRKLLIFNNIRLQLNEQLRCLDVRMESQVSLIQELQDFFRRRGEVELDYSKSLDKLAKSLQLRHKEQKQKREQWPMFSSYACWQQLVNQTKSLSKDHAALSEIYSTHLVARLQTVIEDVQRIYKKCREIGYETHEEILRVLQELHTTMKTYHSYQSECKAAEAKLRTAESQRAKLQLTNPKEKLERSKKYRLIEKEMLKRKSKYSDARLKALKAKNEYQLCLEASNTTIHKYFVEDLSDLIDCMDLGFHSMVSRALLMHVTADQGRCRAVLHNSDTLSHTVHSMDSRADKQKFLELYHGAFMIPKRLEFQGQLQEAQPVEPELQKALHSEMEARLQHLGQRVGNLRTESEEIWKTLETAELSLLEILNIKDYDSSSHFGDSTTQSAKPESLTIKLRADKQEIEEFYITKIREYILGTSRIARLDAKAELLRTALAKDSALQCNNTLLVKTNVPKRKRIGRMNMTGQPKLFGGSLEEYLETTNEEIPLIMRSCIRVINLFGLHHQGIFRVSGSQVEISNFREGFERGEDPLADTTDASDINSVAGVLKLYLRELREPLFPIIYFDHFVTLAQIESKHELVCGIRKFLQSLSRPVIIVIRYLFAFLNHLSEYSDENMMDAYNLAICFGPTLMPAPEDKDQVQYQNQVNELIKSMIVYHEELFPKDLGGISYEKYISPNDPLDEIEESPTEQLPEDPDSEVCPSEDESDTMMEGTVQFDFTARSNRELSLRKGDHVILRKQVSNDWWQGTVKGKDGLIPDKYISVKIKGEDRDKSSDHLKSSSSEESVRKRRPSGNLIVNNQQQLSIYTNVGSQSKSQSTDDGLSTSTSTVAAGASTASSSSSQNPSISSTINVVTPPGVHDSANILLLKQQTLNDLTTSTTISTAGGGGGGDRKQHQSSAPLNIIPNQKQQQQQQPPLITDQYNENDCVDHNVNVKSKYNYHDEPHSFENSMEFLEDFNHFQYEVKNKKLTEPIYAEPSKVPQQQQQQQQQQKMAFGSSSSGAVSVSASASGSSSTPLSTSVSSTGGVVGLQNKNNNPNNDMITNLHFNEYEGVALRNPKSITTNCCKIIELPLDYSSNRKSETIITTVSSAAAGTSNKIENNYSNISGLIKPKDNLPDGSKNIILLSRHSDSEVLKEQQQQLINDRQILQINKDLTNTTDNDCIDSSRPPPSTRKFHSKSFSLSENRIASNFTSSIGIGGGSTIDYNDNDDDDGGGGGGTGSTTNLFQQNRKLWEKRTVELHHQQQQQQNQQQQQQQSQYLSTPRILTRNRIAPDLVMDLPFPVKDQLKSHNSQDSLDTDGGDTDDDNTIENGTDRSPITIDDLNDSGAERFATQHQCTLKKNERFSNGSVSGGGGNNNNNNVVISTTTVGETKTVTSTSSTTTTSTTTSTTSTSTINEKKEVKLDYKDLENNKPKAKVKPQESTNKDNSIQCKKSGVEPSATMTINENILHIQESHDHQNNNNNNNDDGNQLNIDNCNATAGGGVGGGGGGGGVPLKELHKSPIPLRNTQKFVSKFADLHLTGGCLNVPAESASSSSSTATTSTTTTTPGGIIGSNTNSGSMNNICQTTTLSSFKPQVKVKPQLMKKPLVLPGGPTTPEMIRRQHQE